MTSLSTYRIIFQADGVLLLAGTKAGIVSNVCDSK